MSEVSLRELLDLSIYPPSEGISNVNYTAMRKLLQCIVQRLEAESDVEKAVLEKKLDEQDVGELEERSSESSEQQNALVEPPSGTELSLYIPDPTREDGVSKSTSLMQDLFKKNQELEERTNNQKEELDILQNQLSKSASVMQDLINKNLELEEETNKLRQEMETLQYQLEQGMIVMQDLLKEETNDIKNNVGVLQNPSLMRDLFNENQELKEKINNLRKEMETLKNKFSQVYEMDALDPESSGLKKERDTTEISASESLDGSDQQNRTTLPRNAVQQLYIEVQNIKQELQVFILEQKETSENDIQNKFTELTNDMQRTISQLQSEFERFQKDILEDGMQEQAHIDNLSKSVSELQGKVDMKADTQTMEITVAETTQQLTGMFQDLLNSKTEFEENHNMVTEKIFRELKLSQAELERLQKLIEMLQKAQSEEIDNAAIVKKRLTTRFHCLSCDRPVNMKTPGPRVEVLPVLPAFPLRHHRRSMTSTNVSQSTRSSTERSMKQTRKGESCVSDGLINIGYCEYHVNHSQMSESISKNYKQGSPLGLQHSETDMICVGTSCFRKEKQWIPEDSLSQNLQSQPQVSPLPTAKE